MNKSNKTSQEVLDELNRKEKSKKKWTKKPILSKVSLEDVDNLKKQEEKEKAEKEKQERRKEREEQIRQKRKKEAKIRKKEKIKKKFKFIKKLVDWIDEDDKNWIMDFVPYVLVNGLLINFAFYCIFGTPFMWYSFIGYGIALWYIENNFVNLVRKLWKK